MEHAGPQLQQISPAAHGMGHGMDSIYNLIVQPECYSPIPSLCCVRKQHLMVWLSFHIPEVILGQFLKKQMKKKEAVQLQNSSVLRASSAWWRERGVF